VVAPSLTVSHWTVRWPAVAGGQAAAPCDSAASQRSSVGGRKRTNVEDSSLLVVTSSAVRQRQRQEANWLAMTGRGGDVPDDAWRSGGRESM